jgi:hypothetical protein
MGRGRQKAKHTKVARDLKYFSPDTNYDSLAKELGTATPGDPRLAEDLEKWPEFSAATDSYAEDEYASDAEDESKSA